MADYHGSPGAQQARPALTAAGKQSAWPESDSLMRSLVLGHIRGDIRSLLAGDA